MQSESGSDNDDIISGASSSEAEESEKEGSWSFGNTKVRNFLSSITGNKVSSSNWNVHFTSISVDQILTEEDLEPALNEMRQIVCLAAASVRRRLIIAYVVDRQKCCK